MFVLNTIWSSFLPLLGATRENCHSMLRQEAPRIAEVTEQHGMCAASVSPFVYLLGSKHSVPCVPSVPSRDTPNVEGTLEEFVTSVEKRGGRQDGLVPLLKEMAFNKVKKCGNCGKCGGATMTECNGCNQPLGEDLTEAPNVFTAFILGTEKVDAKIPGTMSIRRQTEDLLVFDDMLQMSSCHYDAIPTDVFAESWLTLLSNPSEGLRLVRRLREGALQAALDNHFSNQEWLRFTYTEAALRSIEEARAAGQLAEFIWEHSKAGFNFPPSQGQLHLQFTVLPLMPHHLHLVLEGVHMFKGRFFPFDFVESVLQGLVDKGIKLADAHNKAMMQKEGMSELLRFMEETLGLDYEKVHTALLNRVLASQAAFRLSPSDFEFSVHGKLLRRSDGEFLPLQESEKQLEALVKEDKEKLKTIGHRAEGQAAAFYKFPKWDMETNTLHIHKFREA